MGIWSVMYQVRQSCTSSGRMMSNELGRDDMISVAHSIDECLESNCTTADPTTRGKASD